MSKITLPHLLFFQTFNFQLSINMRDLFTTIGTRYLIAILNLALIFINAKVLGVEGVGLVGLILAIVGIATCSAEYWREIRSSIS